MAPFALMRILIDIGRRSFSRFVELEAFDRSMALAGQAFATLLPLLIVVATVSPRDGDDLADTLIDSFDLSGASADTLDAAFAQPDAGVSALGVPLLVISALSFTRALQRLYIRAWRIDKKLGLRGNIWGLEWLALFIAYWSAQPFLVGLFDGVLALIVSLSLSTALWLFTPWLLVAKQISWKRLLPQAILTAVGLAAVAIGCAVYLPRAIATASDDFGFLGVAFTILSLFFAVAFVLVATAALGTAIVETGEDADHPDRVIAAHPPLS